MPLDASVKSQLRDKVSTANKSNVDQVIAAVEEVRGTLAEDDKDYTRLSGWIEELQAISGGSIIGRTGDVGNP